MNHLHENTEFYRFMQKFQAAILAAQALDFLSKAGYTRESATKFLETLDPSDLKSDGLPHYDT